MNNLPLHFDKPGKQQQSQLQISKANKLVNIKEKNQCILKTIIQKINEAMSCLIEKTDNRDEL